jgi:chromosome segregation ATPase
VTPAEQLAHEVEALQARLRSTKRALKVLQGQQRHALQLLAAIDAEFSALLGRLESTAKEAKEHEYVSTVELFV